MIQVVRWIKAIWRIGILISVLMLIGPTPCALAQDDALSLSVRLESREVFLGESFPFQIVVADDVTPDVPELAAASADFEVEVLEPSHSENSQISVINGRVSRKTERQTVLSYRLKPRRLGTLTIPAVTVRAGDREGTTQPVSVLVREPIRGEGGPISLAMALSKDTVTVGEPFTVSWTWTIAANVRGYEFHLPLYELERFVFPDVDVQIDPRLRDQYLGIRLAGGRELVGRQQRLRRQGNTLIEVTFEQIVIPTAAGRVELPASTVVCEVVTARGRNLFDRDVTRKVAVSSNQPVLTVKALPEEGRPAGFVGHVGRFSLGAAAKPTEVQVGEPITLTVRLSGPDYLDDVRLPPLEQQESLVADFRISDPEPGRVEDGVKVFKRILRAKHPDVHFIPPIELVYFDTEKQTYETTASDPIPLTVTAAKVVTALDAEGQAIPASNRGQRLQTWSRGIAANYEDMSVLQDQRAGVDTWFRSPAFALLLVVPPLAYLALLGMVLSLRRRRADPRAAAARAALSQARKRLRRREPGDEGARRAVLDALRHYFGLKLGMAPGAITFRDVHGPLVDAGVSESDVDTLQELFLTCEAGQYAGLAEPIPDAGIDELAESLLKRIDRTLR